MCNCLADLLHIHLQTSHRRTQQPAVFRKASSIIPFNRQWMILQAVDFLANIWFLNSDYIIDWFVECWFASHLNYFMSNLKMETSSLPVKDNNIQTSARRSHEPTPSSNRDASACDMLCRFSECTEIGSSPFFSECVSKQAANVIYKNWIDKTNKELIPLLIILLAYEIKWKNTIRCDNAVIMSIK